MEGHVPIAQVRCRWQAVAAQCSNKLKKKTRTDNFPNSPLGSEEGTSGVDVSAGGGRLAGGGDVSNSRLLGVVVADGAGRALSVAVVLGLGALGAVNAAAISHTNGLGSAGLGHVGVDL